MESMEPLLPPRQQFHRRCAFFAAVVFGLQAVWNVHLQIRVSQLEDPATSLSVVSLYTAAQVDALLNNKTDNAKFEKLQSAMDHNVEKVNVAVSDLNAALAATNIDISKLNAAVASLNAVVANKLTHQAAATTKPPEWTTAAPEWTTAAPEYYATTAAPEYYATTAAPEYYATTFAPVLTTVPGTVTCEFSETRTVGWKGEQCTVPDANPKCCTLMKDLMACKDDYVCARDMLNKSDIKHPSNECAAMFTYDPADDCSAALADQMELLSSTEQLSSEVSLQAFSAKYAVFAVAAMAAVAGLSLAWKKQHSSPETYKRMVEECA